MNEGGGRARGRWGAVFVRRRQGFNFGRLTGFRRSCYTAGWWLSGSQQCEVQNAKYPKAKEREKKKEKARAGSQAH